MLCGVGSGQTRSLQSIGQNSLILSNKYCRRSSERPGGWMIGGRLDTLGFQLLSFKRLTSLSGLVKESFTVAIPGLTEENVKWCIALMPLRAVCLNGVLKNCAQS